MQQRGFHHIPQTASMAMERWKFLGYEATRWSKAKLSPKDLDAVERFTAAYRRSATELARVKAFSPDKQLAEYIEQAVAVSHFAVHRRRRPKLRSAVEAAFFTFPHLVRKHWRYHVASFLITMLAAAIAFVAVLYNPDTYYLFINRDLAGGRDPSASTEYLLSTLGPQDVGLAHGVLFSSELFTHNTRVAFVAFAFGIALGIPTIYILIINGLMLGSFTALFVSRGLTVEYLAWIMPHGIPELGAIFLCGGAGLAIGHRVLNPGGQPRGAAIRKTAGEASLIALGCVPLLLAAGFIEGIFRQSEASTLMRYALFISLFVGLGAWFLLTRKREPKPTSLERVSGVT
jgi:uncharacterized membrane protein SpoIIM required for sporulation